MNVTKSKRILYVITKSNFGGAQRYVFELACEMKKLGHEVAVASAPTGRLVEELKTAEIPHIPIPSLQRNVSLLKEFRVLTELRSTMKQFAPDVVHLNSSKVGGLGAVAARLCRVPLIVFTAHGWPWREPRAWWWKTLAWLGSYITMTLVHTVIVVSRSDRGGVLWPWKLRCQVIPTAVPQITQTERAEARALFHSPDVIAAHQQDAWLVSVAELHHNKNLTTAIDAVATYNQTNSQKIFYTIVGEGEQKQQLEEHIADKGATGEITICEYVPNVRSHLSAFDLFILPSLKEGLPYTILEAGTARLPVIASEVGGIPEVIVDHETGRLIKPGSESSAQAALTELILNPDERARMSDNLYNHIAEHYQLKAMVKATLDCYSSRIDKSDER